MADIKTHLRELCVATTVGLLSSETDFNKSELYDPTTFLSYARQVVSGDISSADNLKSVSAFTGELKQIVDNGYRLGKAIVECSHFDIGKNPIITWLGNDTQKSDPVDITISNYGFSLKEESFILENMGLYKLLNCYTGSHYKKRHIFNDYARSAYEQWFDVTWNKLILHLALYGSWRYNDPVKQKCGIITADGECVKLEYQLCGKTVASSVLPKKCSLLYFERHTSAKTREQVFSKFINHELDKDPEYNASKKACAIAAADALADELNKNLNYNAGLPRFLRIHEHTYYYAKTTSAGVEIYKVPSIDAFGNDIVIESIKSSVPDKQANILTCIKNTKTGKTLVLRNECRFSHGQFNGTPEAKMYYECGGSLEAIYEKL